MASLTKVANTISNLPLQEIANDMRSASRRLNGLLSDPVLDQSLQRLDRSLAEVERITRTAGQNADPIMKSLRNASASAERTATSVEATAEKAGASIDPIVTSLRNAAESARVYTIDPRDHLRAERDAEDRSWEIVGVVHSHTHTEPFPSPTDIGQTTDPGWHYEIIGLKRDSPELRSYRIVDGMATEEPIEVA